MPKSNLQFTIGILCILCFLYHIGHVNEQKKDVSSLEAYMTGLYTLRNFHFRPFEYVSKASKNSTLWTFLLLLSGDIEINPGPETKWPCRICEYPVTWSQEGVACDSCELWHHKSCISLCSEDFNLLERSNVVWKCCKCDSLNCDSFTFHSFELQISNTYFPLSQLNNESTLDSFHSKHGFSPLHTSSPKPVNSQNSQRTPRDKLFSTTTSECPYDLPKKQNLRILNINCRSVKENNAEFKTALEYIKPDIICGTESWLRGKKPGKPYSKSAIQNSEIFPDNYTVFRNDRSSRGGGVFVAVQSNITAVECVDFVTDCEIDFAKVTLKGKKELYIGSFYMPKRNMKDLFEQKKISGTLERKQT